MSTIVILATLEGSGKIQVEDQVATAARNDGCAASHVKALIGHISSSRCCVPIGTYGLYPKSGIAIHRSRNMCAAILGFLSLVNTPFLLPWTRIIP